MLGKLQAIEDKFLDLESKISDPSIIANQTEWQKLTRTHAKLSEIVEVFREYKQVRTHIDDAKEMKAATNNHEMQEMIKAE